MIDLLRQGEQDKVVTTLREMETNDSGSDDHLANVDASEICSVCWDARVEVGTLRCIFRELPC